MTMLEWEAPDDLELPNLFLSYLDTVIPKVADYCTSILLCGSWSVGDGNEKSDLDILYIVKDDGAAKQVHREIVVHLLNFAGKKQLFDNKIITEADLNAKFKGIEYFAVWSLLKRSILLFGKDIRERNSLQRHRLSSLLGTMLNRLSEAYTIAEDRMGFRGAAVTVVDVTNTVYFIRKLALGDSDSTGLRYDFIQNITGPMFDTVMKIYNETCSERIEFTPFSGTIRIGRKEDQRYSEHQYRKLIDIIETTENEVTSVKKDLDELV